MLCEIQIQLDALYFYLQNLVVLRMEHSGGWAAWGLITHTGTGQGSRLCLQLAAASPVLVVQVGVFREARGAHVSGSLHAQASTSFGCLKAIAMKCKAGPETSLPGLPSGKLRLVQTSPSQKPEVRFPPLPTIICCLNWTPTTKVQPLQNHPDRKGILTSQEREEDQDP